MGNQPLSVIRRNAEVNVCRLLEINNKSNPDIIEARSAVYTIWGSPRCRSAGKVILDFIAEFHNRCLKAIFTAKALMVMVASIAIGPVYMLSVVGSVTPSIV